MNDYKEYILNIDCTSTIKDRMSFKGKYIDEGFDCSIAAYEEDRENDKFSDVETMHICIDKDQATKIVSYLVQHYNIDASLVSALYGDVSEKT